MWQLLAGSEWRPQIGPRVGLCGTSGIKFPAIRAHLQRAIGDVYKGIGVHCETFPADDVTRDPQAYEKALDKVHGRSVMLCAGLFLSPNAVQPWRHRVDIYPR